MEFLYFHWNKSERNVLHRPSLANYDAYQHKYSFYILYSSFAKLRENALRNHWQQQEMIIILLCFLIRKGKVTAFPFMQVVLIHFSTLSFE